MLGDKQESRNHKMSERKLFVSSIQATVARPKEDVRYDSDNAASNNINWYNEELLMQLDVSSSIFLHVLSKTTTISFKISSLLDGIPASEAPD
jgi:hypothetical protein